MPGVSLLESIADRVVMAREERMQDRQPDPPVTGEAAVLDSGARVDRKEIVLEIQLAVRQQFSVRSGAQPVFGLLVAAIQLRRIPPVRDLVGECEAARSRVRVRLAPFELEELEAMFQPQRI